MRSANTYTDYTARYWHQRYDIWSRYDDGILMTNDVWFGVTPEPVAKYVSLLKFTSPFLLSLSFLKIESL